MQYDFILPLIFQVAGYHSRVLFPTLFMTISYISFIHKVVNKRKTIVKKASSK